MYPDLNHNYNHHRSPRPQSSATRCASHIHFISIFSHLVVYSTQVSETERSLLQIEVTGTYLSDPPLIITNYLFALSHQGTQSSPSQEPTLEGKAVLCYCESRCEKMPDTNFAERGATRRVGRERRRLVGNVVFLLLLKTESPTAPYNHTPVLQCLFMRRAPSTKTSSLE
jgi:hypothetical protein